MPSLGPNSLIVITGITGYLASHMGLHSLREGHRVRGTIRPGGVGRIEELKRAYIQHGIPLDVVESRLELMEVVDFFSENDWVKALGADGILHVAYPQDQFFAGNLVQLSLENMRTILTVAKKVKTIKRFVYTSSTAAVITVPMYVDRTLTVEDWHDTAIDIVDGKLNIEDQGFEDLRKLNMVLPYAASKAKCEKFGFDFIEKEKPNFNFISILPAATFGPILYGKPAVTPNAIHLSLIGDTSYRQYLLPQWFVDVRDVAKIQYLALVIDSMAEKRWWAIAEPFGWNQIAAILRRISPEANVVEDYEGGEIDRQRIDNAASTELIGGWINLEDSMKDTVESFRKLGLS
ncbi:hypothetical protein M422DRAFT_245347 [Sphaerobolus stellatus SS14]|nr:hypothetical protein M422DRAFT_245347 [Sphaerobolus stellatus SS14]